MSPKEDSVSRNDEKNKGKDIPIHIDQKMYKVLKATMTGAEIRALAQPPISGDYDLYREVPGPGDDVKVADSAVVNLEPGMHFYSVLRQINPGCCNATA